MTEDQLRDAPSKFHPRDDVLEQLRGPLDCKRPLRAHDMQEMERKRQIALARIVHDDHRRTRVGILSAGAMVGLLLGALVLMLWGLA